VIAVEHLAKRFGKRGEIRAVDDVSFVAPRGEITGLLGPNGAGKTTLLRMLATLIVPDAGHARIGGLDVVAERAEIRRRLGVLSDARGLYPRLTGRENIAYYAALHGLGGADRDKRIDALVDELGLGDVAGRRAQGYSQGEKMKVAIARALVHGPDTILLDEPTNGLDIMSVRALREQLRRLRAEGRTLLFNRQVRAEQIERLLRKVTHCQARAERDAAGIGLQHSCDHAQQRRLARAVLAHDAPALAAADRHVEPVVDHSTAICLRHTLDDRDLVA